MLHTMRWTSQKIRQRIALIEPLVYSRHHPLPPFRFIALPDPLSDPPVSPDVDDSEWQQIPWGSHWGSLGADFVLRSHFHIPVEWPSDQPIALHLPMGEMGNIRHPEALVYIDGQPYAACDRRHQEIRLSPHWHDGLPHPLALHGWTDDSEMLYFDPASTDQGKRPSPLVMHPCRLVQVHQPTRDLVALARVALGVADCLDGNEPARAHLYNSLDEAFKVLDTMEPFGDRFYSSVPLALATLQKGIAHSGPPLDVDIPQRAPPDGAVPRDLLLPEPAANL
jgi:alpha-mannosidase